MSPKRKTKFMPITNLLGEHYDSKTVHLSEDNEQVNVISYKSSLPISLKDVQRNLSRTVAFTSIYDTKQMNRNCYKSRMCELYLNSGSCEYGNRCMYAHSPEELRRPICVFFKNGGFCKKGDACDYSHDLNRDDINDECIDQEDQLQEYMFCASCLNPLAKDSRCYYCLYHDLLKDLQEHQSDRLLYSDSPALPMFNADKIEIPYNHSSEDYVTNDNINNGGTHFSSYIEEETDTCSEDSSYSNSPARRHSFTETNQSLSKQLQDLNIAKNINFIEENLDYPSHLVPSFLVD